MKHAGPNTFARIPLLLGELRKRPLLVECRPGVFYLKSRAFLHFHDHEPDVFADVRVAGEFARYPVTSKAQQWELLGVVDECLAAVESGKRRGRRL